MSAETAPDAADDGMSDGAEDGMESLLILEDMSNPQPAYRRLLEEGGTATPMEGVVVVADRDTVDHVLRHHELFSSKIDLGLGNVRPLIPLNVDPPLPSQYRKLLAPLVAPRRMDEQEEDITRRAVALIESFADRGECNFTEEFAEILPSSVFLGLMGLPQDELRMFLDLRDGILHPEKKDPDATLDPEARQRVLDRTGEQIYEYFGALVDERTKKPADDVLSKFVAAEIDGERLTKDDILDICFLMLIAGLDTVSDSLTCMFAYLAAHPEQRRQIVGDPSCIPHAVEELLRWETPVPLTAPRMATADTELPNGCPVPAGAHVLVVIGAANVDDAACPAALDVRFDRDVNRHIAFGGGVHRCLGSHLARRELRVTLHEWHERIPDYAIKAGHEALEYPPGLRHVKDLTLSWS